MGMGTGTGKPMTDRHRDKPKPAVVHLLNEAAELASGLRRLGLDPDAVGRVVRAYAEGHAAHAARARRVPVERSMGWRDGDWVDLNLPSPED
jgi:hypothetical protein